MTEPKCNDVVIFGTGGHAEVLCDAAFSSGLWRVRAFVVSESTGKDKLAGLPVLSGQDVLTRARSLAPYMHVAIGDAAARQRLSEEALGTGFHLATIIHALASTSSSAKIGAGSAVLAGAVVNTGARLGQGCIVNSGALVEHHCRLGDWVHIAPGARMGGYAQIGSSAWIGIGAVLRDRVSVGERSMIGAGAVVVSDIGSDQTAMGVPARPR